MAHPGWAIEGYRWVLVAEEVAVADPGRIQALAVEEAEEVHLQTQALEVEVAAEHRLKILA